MDLLHGLNPSVMEDFRGANFRGETSDVRPPWLLRAQDVEFEQGFVRTRRGFYESPLRTCQQPVSGFHAFLLGAESYLYTAYAPAGAVTINYSKYNTTPSSFVARASDGLGAVFANIGNRVYYAAFDPDYEEGTFGVHKDIDTSPSNPMVWVPPMLDSYMAAWAQSFTPTASASPNIATAGFHRFALMFTSKTGFITQRSPRDTLIGYTGSSEDLVSGTLAANQKMVITLTPDAGHPWPTYYDTVTLLATTTRNTDRFLIVPGQTYSVSGTGTITLELKIQDAALNLGTPFDVYETVLYEGIFTAATQPIKPYYTFVCGERMGYFFKDPSFGYGVAFSKVNEYEHITFDRHVRYLPHRAKAIAAKWTQGTIYVFVENATYAFTDTGDDPVTWPQERIVDDKVGVNQPYAFSLDKSGNGFVAHRLGLFAFNGGVYSRIPVSYFVQEDASGVQGSWSDINWTMASGNFIVVADDAENYRVLIVAPANFPTVFTFNYLEGMSADKVRYSNLTLGGSVPSWAGIVQNNGDSHSSTRRQQLWIAPGAGKWLLHCPPNDLGGNAVKYKDVINGVDFSINTILDFPFLPERHQALGEQEHHYTQLRVKGTGTLNLEVKSLDELMTTGNLSQTLSMNPGNDMYFGYSLVTKSASARISLLQIAGNWFSLSHFAHYWKPYASRR